MLATIRVNVVCTITDGFELMSLARQEVEETKAPEEWGKFYPDSPTAALQQVIRTAVATKLLPLDCVTLHQIGHGVDSLDIPLEP